MIRKHFQPVFISFISFYTELAEQGIELCQPLEYSRSYLLLLIHTSTILVVVVVWLLCNLHKSRSFSALVLWYYIISRYVCQRLQSTKSRCICGKKKDCVLKRPRSFYSDVALYFLSNNQNWQHQSRICSRLMYLQLIVSSWNYNYWESIPPACAKPLPAQIILPDSQHRAN